MKRKFLLNFVFVGILLVSMYLIWPFPFWYFSKQVILPAGEKIGDLYQMIVSPLKIFSDIEELAIRNKELEEKNNQLESELARTIDNQHYCKIELEEENTSFFLSNGVVIAKIIGRTAEAYNQIIIVDKGSNDSISVGKAAMSSGILIGRVTKVEKESSEIELITSHKSMIPVVFEKSRESGLLKGGIEGIVVSDIPASKQIASGDRILTSGLGGDLPPGILIGQVASVVEGSGLFQSVNVVTSVDLSSIEVVSIAK